MPANSLDIAIKKLEVALELNKGITYGTAQEKFDGFKAAYKAVSEAVTANDLR